ncbi:MAG: ComF family protein [Thermodesulfovibrionia bacterium]|nr:ComF family protein [Thermodesulfovibrionia bacterium]
MMNAFLKILFPEVCPVCRQPSTCHKTAPICRDCWEGIAPYRGPLCRTCGKPLVSEESINCGDCLKEEPAFTWARSYGLYEGTLRVAVNLFKYYRIKRLSLPLSEMVCKITIPRADVIIPVPLFKKKIRQREFNQSALLAKHFSDNTGAALILNCISRDKETMPQVGLNARERRKNVRNAFRITNEHLIEDKNVILVDDVFTTGATMRECSKMLKKAGAGNIYGVTIAHSSWDS